MKIDIIIFDLITKTFQNSFFDFIMPVLSDAKFWRLPILVMVVCLAVFGKKKGLKTILLLILAVSISDFICGSILQPLISRPRPLGGVTPSFPSCHASNMFAAAAVIYYSWRKLWVGVTVVTVALLVGYSRVYTTSHYPSDVFFGMVFGTTFAIGIILLYNLMQKKKQEKEQRKD
ncbi:MAG: phosphatase PAP2 family protein [Elusimicrobia bacterium]|nr:phosphatase PAP2 family protein [Candidatus Liberimonas magnetica]